MSLNDKRLPTKQDVNWLRACDHLVPCSLPTGVVVGRTMRAAAVPVGMS